MAGYIGSKMSVTLVDGYTQTEAESRYANVTGDTMTGNLSFGDNNKAIFGAGSDLQIFHDGNNSFINNTVTGAISLKSDDINLLSSASENMATFVEDGAVTLYHDNAAKFATTSTGVDVTGTAVTDGLTVAGNVSVDGGTIKLDGNYPVGSNNVALGDTALDSVTSGGTRNTAIGFSAGTALTTQDYNVFVGSYSGDAATGSSNVAVGDVTLRNASGNYNTAIGGEALNSNTTASTTRQLGIRLGIQLQQVRETLSLVVKLEMFLLMLMTT